MKRLIEFCIWIGFSIRTIALVLLKANNKRTIILDLDNTLIDTAGQLIRGHSFIKAFETAPLRNEFIQFIHKKHKRENIIIVSARNFRYHKITKRYLSKHKSINYPFVLVPNPYSKYLIYKYILTWVKEIVIYDDLSGGHETGKKHLYEDVATKIKLLHNTTLHYGDQIEKFQIN